ncbi:MAG TPA: hypothetical protein VM370_04355 [Candidatus Thermoplasmatota archaeon]|nr:hypothetical protein [Candidatus Thermoplasmatota archaeon]
MSPGPGPVKLLYGAGGLSIAASIVHGGLTSAHFSEWWLEGVFFTLAAMAQGIYGFVILSSHAINGAPIDARWPPATLRAFYVAGIVGNAALVLTYVASRTVGFLGVFEAWDALGIMTKLLECALIAVLAALLWRPPAPSAPLTPAS